MLDDGWRHFGTTSWTIPTYKKNSTDGISILSRTIGKKLIESTVGIVLNSNLHVG